MKTDLSKAEQIERTHTLHPDAPVAVEELDAIPGVAATRADSIISARPFASVHEIILVEGVGSATFEKILAHGKSLTRRSAPEAGTRES